MSNGKSLDSIMSTAWIILEVSNGLKLAAHAHAQTTPRSAHLLESVWYVHRKHKQCTNFKTNKTPNRNNNNLLIINLSCSLVAFSFLFLFVCRFGCLIFIFISSFFFLLFILCTLLDSFSYLYRSSTKTCTYGSVILKVKQAWLCQLLFAYIYIYTYLHLYPYPYLLYPT